MTTRSAPTLGVALLAAVALAGEARAQPHPDFSGHWTLDTPFARGRGAATPGPGSGWGAGFTIFQGADTLLVERMFFAPPDLQPPMRFRYALSGSETENQVLMGRGIQRQRSTVVWERDALVITTTYHDPVADRGRGVTSRVRYTLSLEPAGRDAHPPLLVIETRREGVLGGGPTTVRSVYVRG
jgi:hypothetical protein